MIAEKCKERFSLVKATSDAPIDVFRRRLTMKYGNQNLAAKAWGITRGTVNNVWLQKRPIPKWMADDLKIGGNNAQ